MRELDREKKLTTTTVQGIVISNKKLYDERISCSFQLRIKDNARKKAKDQRNVSSPVVCGLEVEK